MDLNVRYFILAAASAGLLAAMGTEAQAQYTQGYVPQSPPMVYRYVYPTRPAYVRRYRAVVPQATRPPNPTGYVNRPYYGAYGYGFYSNGSTDGFPPFQGRRSR